MFADYIKLFTKVKYSWDQKTFRKFLSVLTKWCKIKAIKLNISKCHVIFFKCYGWEGLELQYNIKGTPLKAVNSIRDLGVIMFSTLSPADHINYVPYRANFLSGFIFRSTRNFKSILTLVTLYKTLVQSILAYGSLISSPLQLDHIDSLEIVQTRYIRILGLRLDYCRETLVYELGQMFDL